MTVAEVRAAVEGGDIVERVAAMAEVQDVLTPIAGEPTDILNRTPLHQEKARSGFLFLKDKGALDIGVIGGLGGKRGDNTAGESCEKGNTLPKRNGSGVIWFHNCYCNLIGMVDQFGWGKDDNGFRPERTFVVAACVRQGRARWQASV